MAMSKEEHDALVAMLTEAPEEVAPAADIEAAMKLGLTRHDVEWNQRLGRLWTYYKPGADEDKARVAYFVDNGVEPDVAKEYVENGR